MEEPQKTRNMYEIRQSKLQRAWTDQFNDLKKRDRIPLILLIAILGMEVAHWLIF